jgi:hypothetical protein
VILAVAEQWRTIVYYLLFLVLLEFVLRIGRVIATRRLGTGGTDADADVEEGA